MRLNNEFISIKGHVSDKIENQNVEFEMEQVIRKKDIVFFSQITYNNDKILIISLEGIETPIRILDEGGTQYKALLENFSIKD